MLTQLVDFVLSQGLTAVGNGLPSERRLRTRGKVNRNNCMTCNAKAETAGIDRAYKDQALVSPHD
jgi:hypothetical protein